LHWECLDLDLGVFHHLLPSVFPGPEWLTELGRVGGRKSSAPEAAAARRNGRKGSSTHSTESLSALGRA